MPPVELSSENVGRVKLENTVDEHFSTLSLNYSHHAHRHYHHANNSIVPPANTPLKLTKLNNNINFNNQKFYDFSSLSSVGGLMVSCFKPMINNFFYSAKNDQYLTSDTDSENFEISLESIDVNFKENYIGGGNQSSVFCGKLNGNYIALKKLNRASEVDIKKLKSLNHPNVIKTLGICTKDIYPLIIMEYCEKGGLFDVLRKTKISKTTFLRWSIEIAEGMHYLHSLKIVHRDLKSPNILVDNNDHLKICDFGSLYAWEKTHMPSVVMSVCGTSQWMCPEMLKNEPCNEKVDVWSFGVVLWELLVQEIPYKNFSPMGIMYGVGSGQLQLHIPKTAPETFKMLLRSCWAKRPRNRPSFVSTFTHLANLRVEIAKMSEDAWAMRKNVWQREISDENEKLAMSNSGDINEQKAEELVKKRMHELRHAQEIRQMYEKKMKRVNKIMKKLFSFLEDIRVREEKLIEREQELNEKPRWTRRHKKAFTTSFRRQQFANLKKNNNEISNFCNKSVIVSNKTNNFLKTTCLPANPVLNQHLQHGKLFKVKNSMIVCATKNRGQTIERFSGKLNDQIQVNNVLYAYGNNGQRPVVTIPVNEPNNNNNFITLNAFTNTKNAGFKKNSIIDDDIKNRTAEYTVFKIKKASSTSSLAGSCTSAKLDNELKNFYIKNSHNQIERDSSSRDGDNDEYEIDKTEQVLTNQRLQHQMQKPSILLNNIITEPTRCLCCQHHFFNRNSLARASNISADSGYSHFSQDMQFSNMAQSTSNSDNLISSAYSANVTESILNNKCYHHQLYRNAHGRWSDSSIQQKTSYQQARNYIPRLASYVLTQSAQQCSSSKSVFINHQNDCRSLPSLNALEVSSLSQFSNTSKFENYVVHSSANLIDVSNKFKKKNLFRCQSSSKILKHQLPRSSYLRRHSLSSNFLLCDNSVKPQFPVMELKTAKVNNSSLIPAVHNTFTDNVAFKDNSIPIVNSGKKEIRLSKSDATPGVLQSKNLTSLKPLNSMITNRIESSASSNLFSSLERSLEIAVANSDDLSDKESKLRIAKFSFKTHLKTISNPITNHFPTAVCETSTESDNDPLHC